jgi:hypothetical protein
LHALNLLTPGFSHDKQMLALRNNKKAIWHTNVVSYHTTFEGGVHRCTDKDEKAEDAKNGDVLYLTHEC